MCETSLSGKKFLLSMKKDASQPLCGPEASSVKGIAPSYLSKNGFLMRIVVFRNAGLDLLEGLKDDTHNDDDRSSTK